MVSMCYQDAISTPDDGVDEAVHKYFKGMKVQAWSIAVHSIYDDLYLNVVAREYACAHIKMSYNYLIP